MRIALLKQGWELRAETRTLRETVRDASAAFLNRIPPTTGLIVWLIVPLEQMQDQPLQIRADASRAPRTACFLFSTSCGIHTSERLDQFPHSLLHAASALGGWAMTFEEILDQAIAMLRLLPTSARESRFSMVYSHP